jgi:hypothetical protein
VLKSDVAQGESASPAGFPFPGSAMEEKRKWESGSSSIYFRDPDASSSN